ncbi:MAG TPA: hypothetical protein VF691_15760, partial [Cytophagaceae bacterium]
MKFKFYIRLVHLVFVLPTLLSNSFGQTHFVITPNGHTARINKVIYTHDGEELITASDDKSLSIWNIKSQLISKRYYARIGNGNEGKIYALALSVDGTDIAFAGNTRAGNSDSTHVIIINKKTEHEISFPAHNAPITSLQYSKDGTYLASASADSTVKIWKTNASGKFELHQSFVFPKGVLDIDWAYDRAAIAVAVGNKTVYLLEVSNEKVSANMSPNKSVTKHFHAVRCVAFSPDSTMLVTGGDDYLINMYTARGSFLKTLYKSSNPITDIAFSYDSQNIVFSNETSGIVECIAIAKGKSLSKYTEFDNTVQSLAFSPLSAKGHYEVTAAGGLHHELRSFSAINGKTLKVFSHLSESFYHLQFKENSTLAFNTHIKESNLSKEIDFNNAIVRKTVGERMDADFENKNLAKYKIGLHRI